MNQENYYSGHRERLKEKFLKNKDALHDYELIEIMLFFSIPRKNTKILAKKLLSNHKNSLCELFYSEQKELKKINGIGKSSISLIKLISQIFRKTNEEKFTKEGLEISNKNSLIAFLKSKIAFIEKENFCIIYLNKQLKLIAYEINNYGTSDEIAVYPNEIIKNAFEHNAKHIILAHNHPSKISASPSKQDKEQTKTINKLCASMNIDLIDHLILSGHHLFSFYDNGLL